MAGRIVVAAENAPEAIYTRAHFQVANSINTEITSDAHEIIQMAIDLAGSRGAIEIVGTFYLSDSINISGSGNNLELVEFTQHGLLMPANDFPNNGIMIKVGQHLGYRVGMRLRNLLIDGRQAQFRTGSTINKTIHAIAFSSAWGHIDGTVFNFTGDGLQLTHPAGSKNENTDAHLENLTIFCCLGANIDSRVVVGVTGQSSTDMHWVGCSFNYAGYYYSVVDDVPTYTQITENSYGFAGNMSSLQLTACHFDHNSGYGILQNAPGKYTKLIACTMNYNGAGGYFGDGGPSGWLISNCYFVGNVGTALDMLNATTPTITSCHFDSHNEAGTVVGTRAIHLRGSSGGAIIDDYYIGDGFTTPVQMPTGNILGTSGFIAGDLRTKNTGTYTISTNLTGGLGSGTFGHGLMSTPDINDVYLTYRGDPGDSGRVWVSSTSSTNITLAWQGIFGAIDMTWRAEVSTLE